MLREEEERYQLETGIPGLFWMSLALVPLWLSRQEVSWSAVLWTQSVPVVKTWRERTKRGAILREDGTLRVVNTMSQVSCFSLPHSALLPPPHIMCSAHPFPPLLFPVFPFLTFLLHHASSCNWAHILLLGHQSGDGYQPHSPLQRGQCFTSSLSTLVFLAHLPCLLSHHFWPVGRVIILLWPM